MINSNVDLEKAYGQVLKGYSCANKDAVKLRKIGYRNKWNYIVAEGNQVGLAFNFTADHSVYGPVDDMEQFIRLQQYIGKSLFEFVEYLLKRKEIQMRSLCLAALNALSQPLINNYLNQEKSISTYKKGNFDFIKPQDVVTVVGYGGVVTKIYGKCKELHVSDMRPRYLLNTLTIGEKIEYGPENDEKPVINIPGPIIAAFLAMDWCVLGLVHHYYGLFAPVRPTINVKLEKPLQKNPHIEVYTWLYLTKQNDGYMASPVGYANGLPHILAKADALFIAPIGVAEYQAGEEVKVELLHGLESLQKIKHAREKWFLLHQSLT